VLGPSSALPTLPTLSTPSAADDDVEQAMFADVVEGDFTPRVDDVAAPPYPAAAAETMAERPATPDGDDVLREAEGWLAGSTTETLDALARDVEASGEEVAWAAGGPWDPLTPAAVSRVAKADAAALSAAKDAAAAKARDLDRIEAYDAIFDRGRAGEWASRGGVLELAARDAADDVADEAVREALYQVAGESAAARDASSKLVAHALLGGDDDDDDFDALVAAKRQLAARDAGGPRVPFGEFAAALDPGLGPARLAAPAPRLADQDGDIQVEQEALRRCWARGPGRRSARLEVPAGDVVSAADATRLADRAGLPRRRARPCARGAGSRPRATARAPSRGRGGSRPRRRGRTCAARGRGGARGPPRAPPGARRSRRTRSSPGSRFRRPR